ncbi:pre-16S rRNA-processing nuclease YqgF [Candidatus Gracilibacteria bacterium]|nr:MAG: pre-16S rRNA-processing nuclease YqgF [Candidatus Gracilibacteria bacterium]
MKVSHALGIDRGSKYIGLAYTPLNADVVFPIGYVMNDAMTYYYIADLIQRYHIRKIILGWPQKQKDIQEHITKFMESLNYIIENQRIEIETVDEDFSSVQSGEIVSDFKKNATTDTISAMIILERWKQSKKSEN